MNQGLMRDTVHFYVNTNTKTSSAQSKARPNYVYRCSMRCQIKKYTNPQTDNLDATYYNNQRQIITYNRFKVYDEEGNPKYITIRDISDFQTDISNILINFNNDKFNEYFISDYYINSRTNEMWLTLTRAQTINIKRDNDS